MAWERKDVFPSSTPPPIGSSLESPRDAICRVLGAVRHQSSNKHVATIAIPWPEDLSYGDAEPKTKCSCSETSIGEQEDVEDQESADDLRPRFIQVDVHICEKLENLQWMLFKHAHGDLWNLLGATIRRFGLTIDEVGLYVRIPEIEKRDKKKAKVLLSQEPGEILHFLGLKFDGKQWEEPFASEEDVFEYAATCNLFWVMPQDTEAEGGGEDMTEAVLARKLKSNDRRRMNYRPVFRKWLEEFIPACRAAGRFTSTPLTRDEVRQHVFEYFPGVHLIYDAVVTEWRIKRQREELWKDVIKPAVPDDMGYDRRGCCVSALKKIIMDGNDSFDGILAPPTLKDKDGIFDEDAVRVWVEENWQRVMDTAWRINQERCAALKGATKHTVSGSEKPAGDGSFDGEKVETT